MGKRDHGIIAQNSLIDFSFDLWELTKTLNVESLLYVFASSASLILQENGVMILGTINARLF